MTWPRSVIFHTVADNIYGPYKNSEIVGLGHNPNVHRAADGSYIMVTIIKWKPYYYKSKTIDGVWNIHPFDYDLRGREMIEGMSNLSLTDREDGSILMVCRGGGIWISRDGEKAFKQITTGSVYPKREGRFEDPVIWRDSVQYHLVVNDWLGRIAYYMRSADGVNWIEDVGEAYTPGIAFHEDGTVEDWYKFERIKVFQDEHRRAILANFAVCDTIKKSDLGGDRHSSKNIIIPLNKGVLIDIVNSKIEPKMRDISLLVKSEQGFDPQQDIDLSTLRFGLSSDINFGRGCKVKNTEKKGKDLIVTFNTKGYTIPESEFAPKMMGRNTKGELIYGYARNPNVDFQPAILSSLKPQQQGSDVMIGVDNFGLKASQPSQLILTIDNKCYTAEIPKIESYSTTNVKIRNLTLPNDKAWRIEIKSATNSTVSTLEVFNDKNSKIK